MNNSVSYMSGATAHDINNPFSGLPGAMYSDIAISGIDSAIITSAVSQVITVLTQANADLILPNGQRMKIGANVLLVAPSGSGKSLVSHLLNDPIHAALAESGNDADSGGQPQPYLDDTTLEAITFAFEEWPYRMVASDEGGEVIAKLMRNPSSQAKMAKLLDSERIHYARVGHGRKKIDDFRFSMFLAVQPKIWVDIKSRLGLNSGSVGMGNRLLYFKGDRSITSDMANRARLSDAVLKPYRQKITDFIHDSIRHAKNGGTERKAIPVAHHAEQYLSWLSGEYARASQPGTDLHRISEYTSRSAQRVRQMAGAFHVFEHGTEGEISLETVQQCALIDQTSVETLLRLTYEPPKVTPAMILEAELRRFISTTGISRVQLSEITTNSVNFGLTTAQIKKALAELGGMRRIWVEKHGKTTWVNFPALAYGNYR